jgi:predicted heme/steroid binding protein
MYHWLIELDDWIRTLVWWQLLLFWSVLSLGLYLLLIRVSSKSRGAVGGRGRGAARDQEEYAKQYTPPAYQVYTLEQLRAQGNGKEGNPMLVSVLGVVYDVAAHWTGPILYGHKSAYHCFLGHDASFALASMKFDQLNRLDWENLNAEEKYTIQEWIDKYKGKYLVVGKLVIKE